MKGGEDQEGKREVANCLARNVREAGHARWTAWLRNWRSWLTKWMKKRLSARRCLVAVVGLRRGETSSAHAQPSCRLMKTFEGFLKTFWRSSKTFEVFCRVLKTVDTFEHF